LRQVARTIAVLCKSGVNGSLRGGVGGGIVQRGFILDHHVLDGIPYCRLHETPNVIVVHVRFAKVAYCWLVKTGAEMRHTLFWDLPTPSYKKKQ
jgi:hypothetical protein